MGRAPCCDKANVKRGPWSPEEDAKLKDYIEKYGTGGNWIALPQKVGLKRCGKSCRLRWLNYLRPNIKHGGFTEEEDNIICNLYISIGSRWSVIAAQLSGRTDNDIKNYWNTKLKKKLLGKCKNLNRLSSFGSHDSNGVDESQLSNSSMERMQLHMQLQSLHNPFSPYSTPAMWPKIRPLQEKMIQNLQPLNGSPNSLVQNTLVSPQMHALKCDHFPVSSDSSSYNTANNVMNCLETIGPKADVQELPNAVCDHQPVTTFQTELEDIFENKSLGHLSKEIDQMPRFDYCWNDFKDRMWWDNNDFDANSASTSSWDSTSALDQPQGMFQDYDHLGYNM